MANGGLGNDITAEELREIFQTCGEVLDVQMQPKKLYSFVSYQNASSAVLAMKSIHGRPQQIGERRVFFYLNYIENGK